MTEQRKAKKYLLRAPYAPYDPPSVLEVISGDLIWGNAGNILFSQSVFRALLTDEDTVIDCIKIQCEYAEEEIRRFNSEYDALIIPLANAFRKSFSRELSHPPAAPRGDWCRP